MPCKKVVLIIVEGPTDDDALGVIFTKYFDDNTVRVKIVHGDITTKSRVCSSNILAQITDLVKQALNEYKLNKKDLLRIIHLTDTDGAFAPDDTVVNDATKKKAFYSNDSILTCDPESIKSRNRQKSENIRKLFSTKYIWKDIPYQLYFMSCNLDHVLYNKLNLTDEEKENEALAFAKQYKNDLAGFVSFISNPELAVQGDYLETWTYIMMETNSLHRHTNIWLCFTSHNMESPEVQEQLVVLEPDL